LFRMATIIDITRQNRTMANQPKKHLA
jgi:hypothetical protein